MANGFQGIGSMSQQEILNLALNSLAQRMSGQVAGAPTNAARQHAINLAGAMRDMDSTWDPSTMLGSYVNPQQTYDPQTQRALQGFVLDEIQRRNVPVDQAMRWAPQAPSGTLTADQALNQLGFQQNLQALQGQVMDPRSGQFVMSEQLRQALELGQAMPWMQLTQQGPGIFTQGQVDPNVFNMAMDTLAQVSRATSQAQPRVDIENEIKTLFQTLGLTPNMALEVLQNNMTIVPPEVRDALMVWLANPQNELPRTFSGDTALVQFGLNDFFNRLRQLQQR